MDKYTKILETTQKPGQNAMKKVNQENTFVDTENAGFKAPEVSYPRAEKQRFKKNIWKKISMVFGMKNGNRM